MSFLFGAIVTFAVCVYVETKTADVGESSKLAAVGNWVKGLF